MGDIIERQKTEVEHIDADDNHYCGFAEKGTDYLIRREDAIKAIKRIFDQCEEIEKHLPEDYPDRTGYEMFPDYITVRKYLHQLPFVEPKQKKGKWQRRKGSDCWECSECHAVMESDDFVRHNFYYCYHCGADMMNEDGYMRLEGTEHE